MSSKLEEAVQKHAQNLSTLADAECKVLEAKRAVHESNGFLARLIVSSGKEMVLYEGQEYRTVDGQVVRKPYEGVIIGKP